MCRSMTKPTKWHVCPANYEVGKDNKNADEQDIIAISSSLGLDLNIFISYTSTG